METGFVEEIEKIIRRTSFTVSSIPIDTLKDFKEFCKKECGDVYWVGIFQLLKTKKQYEEIQTQIASLQNQINNLKNKREVRTFE
jgi:hypothetical protein